MVRAAGQVSVTALSDARLRDALAWRQGRAVFNGTPLREALARFARYHGRNLTAADAVAAKGVGGNYSLDDLDGFLSFLKDGMALNITHGPDGSIRVEAADPAAQP
jgi:transmembrane sensor